MVFYLVKAEHHHNHFGNYSIDHSSSPDLHLKRNKSCLLRVASNDWLSPTDFASRYTRYWSMRGFYPIPLFSFVPDPGGSLQTQSLCAYFSTLYFLIIQIATVQYPLILPHTFCKNAQGGSPHPGTASCSISC